MRPFKSRKTKYFPLILQFLLLCIAPAWSFEQLIQELTGAVFPGYRAVIVGPPDFVNSFTNLIPTHIQQLLISDVEAFSKDLYKFKFHSLSAIFGAKLSLVSSIIVFTQLFPTPQNDVEPRGKSKHVNRFNNQLRDFLRVCINYDTVNSLQSVDVQTELAPFKNNLIVTRNQQDQSEMVERYTFSTYSKYSWNSIVHLKVGRISRSILFPDLLTNLNCHPLRISVPKIEGRIATKVIDGEERMFRGAYKTMLENFARIHNASLTVVIPKGGGTGHLIFNVWNGVMGDLVSKNADIGLVVTPTYQRYTYVDFATVVEVSRITFVSGQPLRIYTWKTILWPFSSSTWICLFLSVIVLTLILIAIQRYDKPSYHFKIHYHYLDMLVEMLLEESSVIPNINASKLVLCGWLLFALNATTVYKSKYFALLALPKTETLPKTFKELSNSDFKIGLQYLGGAEFFYINTSTNPSFVNLRKDMELIRGPTACLTKTISSRFCCIAYRGMVEYALYSNLSDKNGQSPLVISSDTYFEAPLGLALQKGAIILEKVNRFIGAFGNGGLLIQWIKKDMEFVRQLKLQWQKAENRTDAFPMKDNGPIAISLKLLSGGFLIAAVGWTVSLMGLIFEFYWSFFIMPLQSSRICIILSYFVRQTYFVPQTLRKP
ncbi:unnamed protein product [Allacma fusca]|uniref:Uncharacterized protein n=1 Tax=Allacma fusca TaxID=39272 RepID=A0A8J2PKA4_9HEXA|nr:unnamed protein product [Allacma fusca]